MSETDDKKSYELTYFLSPDESEISARAEKIKKIISDIGGNIISGTPPQKRKIGQPIRKKTSGYLGILNFEIEPAAIDELKKNLKMERGILRYMMIRKKTADHSTISFLKKTKKTNIVTKVPAPQKDEISVQEKRTRPEEKPTAKESEKIQIEELNKKLEEILKE